MTCSRKRARGDRLHDRADEAAWQRVEDRVSHLCAKPPIARNVRIMIDAEETWLQDAIDDLAEAMMRTTQPRERHVVFTTAQLYRHDRLAYVRASNPRRGRKGGLPSVKLVRGAYMEKERTSGPRNKDAPPPSSPTRRPRTGTSMPPSISP